VLLLLLLLLPLFRLARDTWGEGFTADATVPIPLERWDVSGGWAAALHGGESGSSSASQPVQLGVFLPPGTAAAFDAAAFGLSATEALLVDPQQRLLLEAFAEAHNHTSAATALAAGGSAASCGVFVGISSMDYQKLASRYVSGVTAYSATGVSLSVAAGRLSYSFGLRGPALAIDTACSSSLVAVNAASMNLKAGSIMQAAAAGANLTLSPDTPAMFSRAGMLSPEGRCKTLDAAADGYVRAEAVGVLLLQAYASSDAGSAAGSILAVLAGSAVNQDGRSSSLTAPNGPAQQEVLRAALADGGLLPQDVLGLSMHGTGTPLGRW